VTEEARDQDWGVGVMSVRAATWLAWSLWAICVVLVALTWVLDHYYIPRLPEKGIPNLYVFLSVPLLVYATVGAFVASRRPNNPVGRLLYAVGFVFGLQGFATAYADYVLLVRPGSLPGGVYMAYISQTGMMVAAVALAAVLLVLVFPDGRLPDRAFRAVPWVALGGSATLALWTAVAQENFGRYRYANPFFEGGALGAFFDTMGRLGGSALFGCAVAAVISVFVRLRSADGEKRQQIKWFAYAAAVLLGCLTLFPLMWVVPLWAIFLIVVIGLSAMPVAVGIAVLRYRLYDIDRIINRTLVYGALTAALVAVYFGGVTTTQDILRALTGQEQQPQLAIVISTLVIAALFNPLRRRIQSFIDRRFYRRKYDARKTLEAFAATLRDETDLEALSGDLVGVVKETVQPAHASLWLRPDTSAKGKPVD
jgi:hypothetical protein